LGLWRWIREVVADRGEHIAIPIHLERSEDGYLFRLDARAGFGGQETARIPVATRSNPDPHPILKEIHYCEVAGRTAEAANVYALRAKVAAMLETLAPAGALPLCFFRAPTMDYELPVYEEGDEIVSPVLGARELRARDLAGIRQSVCRFLVSAGYVHDAEEVEIGVLRPSDLSRVAPAAVFRSHVDPELWLPSVEGTSPDGPVVGVLGHARRLRAPERRRAGAGPAPEDTAPAAPDVVALLRVVRAELRRTGGTADPATVYASEVRPEIWKAAERRVEDTGRRLVAHLSDAEGSRLELAICRTGAGDVTAAVFDRHINVLLAPDEDALASQVGRYLATNEFLRFAEEVEIHSVVAPRAERLDAEDIRTHEGGGGTATEEVHA
jgi:hypothetical protein